MKWLIGLVLLGFIVFFHELGHFLAAKLFGVTVESFSLGFGPILVHRTHGTTDYRLSLIPLGGYCGMKGEKEFIHALETDSRSIDAARDSLYGIHPLKRAVIGGAGPLFNILFAWIAFVVIALSGYRYNSYTPTITLVDEVDHSIHSAARDAGLLTGDTITRINGAPISDFSDIIQAVAPHPHETLTVTVDRHGETLTFAVYTDFDATDGSGKIGVHVHDPTPIVREAERYPFFPALWHGALQTGQSIALTFKGIALLFQGVQLRTAISGPARITDMLGGAATEGFASGVRNGVVHILELMALISVSLFAVNMLPIPILDGSMILAACIQTITRRQIHPKVLYYAQFVGLAVIAVLFVIGLTGDITYFFHAFREG